MASQLNSRRIPACTISIVSIRFLLLGLGCKGTAYRPIFHYEYIRESEGGITRGVVYVYDHSLRVGVVEVLIILHNYGAS